MTRHNIPLIGRIFAYLMVCTLFLYLINNYLVYWQELPGSYLLFSHYGWFGLETLSNPLSDDQLTQGWIQVSLYLLVLAATVGYTVKTRDRKLHQDSIRLSALSAYIIRFAFWTVVLVGFADMIISLLRVEDLLVHITGKWLALQLGRPIFRGSYVHYPLIVISFFIAAWKRDISFPWLALMCVLAEFLIVVTRFVFSY